MEVMVVDLIKKAENRLRNSFAKPVIAMAAGRQISKLRNGRRVAFDTFGHA
jgi:hypothetical protein